METKNEPGDGAGQGRRRAGAECLSDLQLDQMHLGELDGVTSDRVRLHVGQCAVCGEAWRVLAADRRAFAQDVDVPSAAARIMAAAYPSGGRLKRWVRGLALPAGRERGRRGGGNRGFGAGGGVRSRRGGGSV